MMLRRGKPYAGSATPHRSICRSPGGHLHLLVRTSFHRRRRWSRMIVFGDVLRRSERPLLASRALGLWLRRTQRCNVHNEPAIRKILGNSRRAPHRCRHHMPVGFPQRPFSPVKRRADVRGGSPRAVVSGTESPWRRLRSRRRHPCRGEEFPMSFSTEDVSALHARPFARSEWTHCRSDRGCRRNRMQRRSLA